MAALRVFAVVCLLGAVLATAAAADEWHEGMMFSDWLHSSAGSSAKVMTSSSYERPGVKRVCLKEKQTTNCQVVGCQAASCNATNGECNDCTPEWMFQSDLACGPSKEHDGYGQPSDPWTQLKIGSCDWHVRQFYCPEAYNGNCGVYGDIGDGNVGFIALENKAIKFADVWATCYLNSDSEYCGEPLCDKMVMTFQGSAFAVYAAAESSYLQNQHTTCEYSYFPITNATRKVGAHRNPWQRVSSALPHTHIGAKLRAERQPGATVPSRKASRKEINGDEYTSGNEVVPQYSSGAAYIFSGPVVISSMAKKVSYTKGMMEYVFDFINATDLAAGQVPPSNVLVVKPYTYDIALVGGKAASEYDGHESRGHESHGSEGGDHGYGYDRHEGEDYHRPEYDAPHGDRPYYEEGHGERRY